MALTKVLVSMTVLRRFAVKGPFQLLQIFGARTRALYCSLQSTEGIESSAAALLHKAFVLRARENYAQKIVAVLDFNGTGPALLEQLPGSRRKVLCWDYPCHG